MLKDELNSNFLPQCMCKTIPEHDFLLHYDLWVLAVLNIGTNRSKQTVQTQIRLQTGSTRLVIPSAYRMFHFRINTVILIEFPIFSRTLTIRNTEQRVDAVFF